MQRWSFKETAARAAIDTEFEEPLKIAIIDDDDDFRNLMEAVISTSGVEGETFRDLSGLSSPRELKSFDAIVVDYYLENIDGVQLSSYFNSFFPDIPVILISGGLMSDDSEEWPDSVKAFIPKEFGPIEIINQAVAIVKTTRH